MPRERHSVDANHLFRVLLERRLADYTHDDWPGLVLTVMNRPDSDVVDLVPYVVYNAVGGRMSTNGPKAWTWVLTVNVVAQDEELGADISDFIDEFLDDLKGPKGVVEGVGWVSAVEDLSLPTLTTTSSTPAGDLYQFTGSWTTLVRKK